VRPLLEATLRCSLREFELAVELEVAPGRCLALVGPSGAGKSTVLRAIAGLHRPDSGRVRLGAETWLDTERGVDLLPERRSSGYLFQEYALFPHLSAWRNVAFPLRGMAKGDRRAAALVQLERLGVAELADEPPSRLSGGERQRVALARALAREPELLLLDEPLAALDPRSRASAGRELGISLRGAGVASVVVTHDFGEAAMLADEVLVLDDGRVVQRGPASKLSEAPRSAFVASFAGADVLIGRARRRPNGMTSVQLDGGGALTSNDRAEGPVAVALYPWEVMVEPAARRTASAGDSLNRLDVRVTSVTEIGNRVRVDLSAPQPLAAELTGGGASGLEPGADAVASFAPSAARLVAR
jgi:molybdate transport system ATP-binding protein